MRSGTPTKLRLMLGGGRLDYGLDTQIEMPVFRLEIFNFEMDGQGVVKDRLKS